jgi:hypothetical protein
MRNKIPENKKRKKVSFSIKPELYEIWKKYCEENNIENYSEYIEKLIIEKIKNIKKD